MTPTRSNRSLLWGGWLLLAPDEEGDNAAQEQPPPSRRIRILGALLVPFVARWDAMTALEDRLAPMATRLRNRLRVSGRRGLRALDRLSRAPAVLVNRAMEVVLRPFDWVGQHVG